MTEDNKDNQGISDTPPDPHAVDTSSVTIHTGRANRYTNSRRGHLLELYHSIC